jgi:hypothetical protein
MTGTMNTSDGGTLSLSNVALEGNALTFTTQYDAGGQMVSLDFDLVVDGDSLEGVVAVGSFGSFDVEGDRTSTPDR